MTVVGAGMDVTGLPMFSPDSRWLAVIGTECAPRVWETATGRGGQFLRGHEGQAHMVTALSFTPDSRHVATTGTDRTIRLWDPETGNQQRIYRGHTAGVLHHALTQDSRCLLSVSGGPNPDDNRVMSWDLTRDQRVLQLSTFTRYWPRGEYQSLLAFQPDGRLLAGYAPNGLAAWDASGVRREEWRFSVNQGNWFEWHGMAVSADGRFAAGRTNAETGVTRLHLGSRQTRSWRTDEPLQTLAIGPDGRLVAAGTRSGRLLLWDAEADKVVLRKEVGPILRLVFSPGGKRLAIAGKGVSWVDVEAGTVHAVPNDAVPGAVVGLAFQPNGPWLAATAVFPGEVRLYDTSKATLVRRWPDARILGDAAFHPGGERVAVATREGFVTIYDVRTGQEVLTLQGLTGRQLDLAFPPRVAFSADGRRLAANDYKSGLWVWEADEPGAPSETLAGERRRRAEGAAFDFHLRAATLCQEENQPGACRHHLGQLKQLEPPSGWANLAHGDLLARARDWPGASAAYRRWLRGFPSVSWLGDWPEEVERFALVQLLAGGTEAYGAFCRQLYDGNKGADLARLCAWGEGAVEPAALLALAQRRLASRPGEAASHLYLGLALYRAGNRDEARAALEKALASGKGDRLIEASAHMGLALVGQRHHLLALDRMAEQETAMWHITNPNLSEWLAFRALHEEVERAHPQRTQRK